MSFGWKLNRFMTASPSPASGLLWASTGMGLNISSVDLFAVSLRTFSISGCSTSRVTVRLLAVWQILFNPTVQNCGRQHEGVVVGTEWPKHCRLFFHVPISSYSFTLGDTCLSVLSESQSTEWWTKLYRVIVHCLRVIYSVQRKFSNNKIIIIYFLLKY